MKIILLLPALLMLSACAQPATTLHCDTREKMVTYLEETVGQTQAGIGLIDPIEIYELFINEHTHTWSTLSTDTHGNSCRLARGFNWNGIPNVSDHKQIPIKN